MQTKNILEKETQAMTTACKGLHMNPLSIFLNIYTLLSDSHNRITV